jgi:hypothetical protein
VIVRGPYFSALAFEMNISLVATNTQKIDQNIGQIRQLIDRIGTNRDGEALRSNLYQNLFHLTLNRNNLIAETTTICKNTQEHIRAHSTSRDTKVGNFIKQN